MEAVVPGLRQQRADLERLLAPLGPEEWARRWTFGLDEASTSISGTPLGFCIVAARRVDPRAVDTA